MITPSSQTLFDSVDLCVLAALCRELECRAGDYRIPGLRICPLRSILYFTFLFKCVILVIRIVKREERDYVLRGVCGLL